MGRRPQQFPRFRSFTYKGQTILVKYRTESSGRRRHRSEEAPRSGNAGGSSGVASAQRREIHTSERQRVMPLVEPVLPAGSRSVSSPISVVPSPVRGDSPLSSEFHFTPDPHEGRSGGRRESFRPIHRPPLPPPRPAPVRNQYFSDSTMAVFDEFLASLEGFDALGYPIQNPGEPTAPALPSTSESGRGDFGVSGADSRGGFSERGMRPEGLLDSGW